MQEAAPGSGRPLKRLRRGTERSGLPLPGAEQPFSPPPAEEDPAQALDQAGRQKRARQTPAVWQAPSASADGQQASPSPSLQAGRHGSGMQSREPTAAAASRALHCPRSAQLQQLRGLVPKPRAAYGPQRHSHSAANQAPQQPQPHSHAHRHQGGQQQPSRSARRDEEDLIDDDSDGDFEPRGALQQGQKAQQGANPFARVRAGSFKVCADACNGRDSC